MATQETMQHHSKQGSDPQNHAGRMYLLFAAMIATSTVVMFLLTYTNAYTWSHMTFSRERLYMAILMGSAMALVMLAFMARMMYHSRVLNAVVVVTAVVLGGLAFWFSRAQVLVEDDADMGAMIPHHSIAILTSERATIQDVRVRELADEIIEAQRREIAEMKWLIADIERNGVAATAEEAQQRPVPQFQATP